MCVGIYNIFVICMHLSVMCWALPMQKCKIDDSPCMKTAAQSMVPTLAAGMPETDMEPLDVMRVDTIKVDLAGLKLVIKDADIKGLKKATIDKISLDMVKKELNLMYHADIVLKGQYKASGRLLILPISGDGDTVIKLKNLQIEMMIPFEIIKDENGKDVLDLKSYKFKYDVKTNVNFHMTNLFNGNKVLSDTMHTFMNENWKALSVEFGTPMLESPNSKIFGVIKKFLRSKPLEDLVTY
ncbi:circadian clock-controlled protein daywake-like [Plodia interpunctella]|uniref:circadian clock-controlled protein daywake-like n=1 Tax=Plodia interpunctella TaxID=58824 RepID=UPI00236818FA|nr:circadian clock-controlled protein daywake-like [Plodia interpunctella]